MTTSDRPAIAGRNIIAGLAFGLALVLMLIALGSAPGSASAATPCSNPALPGIYPADPSTPQNYWLSGTSTLNYSFCNSSSTVFSVCLQWHNYAINTTSGRYKCATATGTDWRIRYQTQQDLIQKCTVYGWRTTSKYGTEAWQTSAWQRFC